MSATACSYCGGPGWWGVNKQNACKKCNADGSRPYVKRRTMTMDELDELEANDPAAYADWMAGGLGLPTVKKDTGTAAPAATAPPAPAAPKKTTYSPVSSTPTTSTSTSYSVTKKNTPPAGGSGDPELDALLASLDAVGPPSTTSATSTISTSKWGTVAGVKDLVQKDYVGHLEADFKAATMLRNDLQRGCPHTARNAIPIYPCCNRIFGCRKCHNAAQEGNHQAPEGTSPYQTWVCTNCRGVQAFTTNGNCRRCNVRFGLYICYICPIADGESEGHHCSYYGDCRISNKEDCNGCNPKSESSDYSSSSYSSSSYSSSSRPVRQEKPQKVKVTCPNCKGKGYWVGNTSAKAHNRCLKCGGSGSIMQ